MLQSSICKMVALILLITTIHTLQWDKFEMQIMYQKDLTACSREPPPKKATDSACECSLECMYLTNCKAQFSLHEPPASYGITEYTLTSNYHARTGTILQVVVLGLTKHQNLVLWNAKNLDQGACMHTVSRHLSFLLAFSFSK